MLPALARRPGCRAGRPGTVVAAALALVVALLVGCSGGGTGSAGTPTTTGGADRNRADRAGPGRPLVTVMTATLARAAAERRDELEIARIAAYVGLAGAQAVTLAAPRAMDFTALVDYPLPTEVPTGRIDGTTAAVEAMVAAARSLLDDPASRAEVANLGTRLAEARTPRIADRETSRRSTTWGRHVGEHIAAWAAADGIGELRGRSGWAAPEGPGAWRPTPPARRPPLRPAWGTLRPFVRDVEACGVTEPLAFETRTGLPYADELRRVFLTARRRDAADEETARRWDDTRVGSTGPAGHWLAIAGRLAVQRRLDADRTARLLAVTATSIADATLVTWRLKYTYARARPVTVIRDLGWDRRWQPYLITPPSPEYPSARAMIAGAAATVLAHHFGDRTRFTDPGLADGSSRSGGVRPRTYPGFGAAAREATRSRLLGGVNLPHSLEASYRLGRCLALQTGGRLDGVRDAIRDPDTLFPAKPAPGER